MSIQNRLLTLTDRAYNTGRMWARKYAENPHNHLTLSIWCGNKMHTGTMHICEGVSESERKLGFIDVLWKAFDVGVEEVRVEKCVIDPRKRTEHKGMHSRSRMRVPAGGSSGLKRI